MAIDNADKVILIGSDFSEESSWGIQVGIAWGQKLGFDCHLFHISSKNGSDHSLKRKRDEIRVDLVGKLQEQMQELQIDKDLVTGLIVEFGPVLERTLDLLGQLQASLLVVGSKEKGILEQVISGNVTQKLLQFPRVTLLAVKDLRALNPKRIYWALDLTDRGIKMLPLLESLAKTFKGQVTVVHILEEKNNQKANGVLGVGVRNVEKEKEEEDGDEEMRWEKVRKRNLNLLVKITEDMVYQGIDVQYEVLRQTHENTAQTLLHHMGQSSYDLMVMGTHGRSGFSRFILGSVAETMLKKGPCSLLIHKE